MRDQAYEDIKFRLKTLGDFCHGVIPHRIAGPGYEPEMSDARELQNDLMLLARKVDAVISAYGEYCKSNGIVSRGDIEDCFTEVLEGALSGNATYCIESGVEDRLEYLRDEYADHKRDLLREDV